MATPRQPDPGQSRTEENEPGGRMSFFEHLTELRKRLVYSLIAIGIGMMVAFTISREVLEWISTPMKLALTKAHLNAQIVYLGPTGVIGPIIHVAFYLGIVLASPYVFLQIWLFIAPGLYKRERKAVLGFVIPCVALFLGGIAFGYYVLVPYVLPFLLSFQGPFVPFISINELYDFMLLVLIGMGCIFELPVLLFFLSLLGVVTPKFLWKNSRYAILIITVAAAVLTPSPDATTMLIFMAPMILLYFAGVGASWLVVRRKRRAEMARTEAN